jgi:hypothetical protein
VGSDETIKQRIEVMKLWVHYCALAKESEYHVKITRNREKGRGVELSIRQFFDENQDILVKTGLLGQGDVRFLAEQTVNNNLTVYFGGE